MGKFLETIKERAKVAKQTIVLPEGADIRTVQAAAAASAEGLADLIILGDEAEVNKLADGLDISKVKIVNPLTDARLGEFANAFYEMRKAKGVTEEQALETMKNPLYFGVMMVKLGLADGMVAGAANATSNVLRPALQILKTAPGTKLVSAFFVICVPDCEYGENGTFIFADLQNIFVLVASSV